MIEVVKGGLILDLGVRGFLPASLVDIRRVQDLDEFLGQELRCKVIELNRSRNNVVLSRRAVLEEERKEQRQQILDRLQPGDVVEGEISNIVDFGAFVDLDGMDGLIHISELSWSHVNHPSEVLQIGQTVKVKVLDIDRERQRISLGLKQTQNDPWQQVLDSYHEGDVVEGRVTKVVTFGAFVEILAGVEGLVHISELAQHHVENPREVVSQGQAVNVKIIEVDAERRRLSLSLKRVEDGDPVQPRADGGESVHLPPNARALRGRGERRGRGRAEAERSRPSRGRAADGRGRRGRAGAEARPRPAAALEAAEVEEPRSPRRSRSCEAEAPRRPKRPSPRPRAEPEPRSRSRADEPEPEAPRSSAEPAAAAPTRPRRSRSEAASDAARSRSRSRAASARGRARRSRRSGATARRRSRATRSSTSCCARRRQGRRSSSGSATASSARTGSSTAARSRRAVFNDRERARLARGSCCTRSSSAEYLDVARAARPARARRRACA